MSIFGDIGNWVAGAVSDGWHAVEGAVEGAAKAISDFVNDAGGLLNVLKHIAEFLGDSEVGFLLGGLAGETLLQVADVFGFSTVEQLYNFLAKLRVPRRLRGPEVDLINSVFKSPGFPLAPVVTTVPTDRIWVTPLLNIMHRPFTLPTRFLATPIVIFYLGPLYYPLYLLASATGLLNSDAYLMNLGPSFYDNGATQFSPDFSWNDSDSGYAGYPYAEGHTLIHETTHVWQGEHWDHPHDYVWNAIFHNVYEYNYTPQLQWGGGAAGGAGDGVLAEQQARMVERWFSGIGPPNLALSPSPIFNRRGVANPLFRFIKNNLWTGDEDAFSSERDVSNLNVDVNAYQQYLLTGHLPQGLTADGDAAPTAGQGGGGSGYSNPYTWGLGGMRPRVPINTRM